MPPERAWVHPEAIAEARAAREWYEARNAEAAERFMAELDLAIERIEEAPRQWPPYLADTRRYLLRRFPFFVVFREASNQCRVSLLPTLDGGLDTGLAGSSSTLNLTRRSSGPGARAARNLAADRQR